MAHLHSSLSSPSTGVDKSTGVRSHVVVKSGVVYYKPAKMTFLKGFQRYWCTLHRETDLYPRQLVFYETSKSTNNIKYEKISQFIPLDNVFKVAVNDEKCHFDIMTSYKKYSIKTASIQEATAWVEMINQEVLGPPLPGIIYEYRVRTDKDHFCKGPMADYLLKVYDDKIKLFTSNGRLPTDFCCDLKDIHRIKYLPTKHLKVVNACLSIAIKNEKSDYQEKDILVMQVKSPIHLSKIISYRKRHITEHNQVTPASMALKASSSGGALKKPLPLGRQLMQKRSAAYEAVTNEHQAILGISRSLQYTRDSDQLLDVHCQSYPCYNSYSDVSASYSSSLYKIHTVQVPSAVTTEDSHDITARPGTAVEHTYDCTYYNLTSLKHHANTTGLSFSSPNINDCDDDDDHSYVIEKIDRYLELLPD